MTLTVKEAPSVPAVVNQKKTKFVAGKSGNPSGRPKGSKNQITLLRQSLELQLREAAAPDMAAVMRKAIDLALEGDRSMIKLLIELHVSKQNSEETNAADKVTIQISSSPPAPTTVTPSGRKPEILEAEIIQNGS
jgi:hypothetical protein